MRKGMRHRLLSLADTSIATLEKQIRSGFGSDENITRTALKVLQLFGAESVFASDDIVCTKISSETAGFEDIPKIIRHPEPQIRSLGIVRALTPPSKSAPPAPSPSG